MTTEDIIIHIFCAVDDHMSDVGKVPQAKLNEAFAFQRSAVFAHSLLLKKPERTADSESTGLACPAVVSSIHIEKYPQW